MDAGKGMGVDLSGEQIAQECISVYPDEGSEMTHTVSSFATSEINRELQQAPCSTRQTRQSCGRASPSAHTRAQSVGFSKFWYMFEVGQVFTDTYTTDLNCSTPKAPWPTQCCD